MILRIRGAFMVVSVSCGEPSPQSARAKLPCRNGAVGRDCALRIPGIAAAVRFAITPEPWLAAALLLGRSPLNRFGIPLDYQYSAAIVAVIAAAILSLFHKRPRSCRDRTVLWMYSLSFAVLMISIFWSVSPDYGLNKMLGFALLVYLPAIIITGTKVSSPRLRVSFCAFGMILLAGALRGGISALAADPDRLSAFGGGPNTFGRFMAIAAISAFAAGSSVGVLLSSIFTWGVLLSQSRGVFVGVFAVAATHLLAQDPRHPVRSVAMTGIMASVLVLGWRLAPMNITRVLLHRLLSILDAIQGVGDGGLQEQACSWMGSGQFLCTDWQFIPA